MGKTNTISSYSTVLIIICSNLALFSHYVESNGFEQNKASSRPTQGKIVNLTRDKYIGRAEKVHWTWSSSCRDGQIQVSQGQISFKGIPRYSVTITNLCSGCSVAGVHLHCGMFASANDVNPNLFKRLAYDDCLVNGGNPIASGKVIEFEYSNTRPYQLSVASYICSH